MSTTTSLRKTSDWAQFQVDQRVALCELVAGDPRPFQQLWVHSAEVSLLGAFGGTALGWAAVRDRLAGVAENYRDARYEWFDQLVEQVADGHAHTVHLEAIRCRGESGEDLVRERRVSKVYRYGRDGWRILHMHADPLLEIAFPGDEPSGDSSGETPRRADEDDQRVDDGATRRLEGEDGSARGDAGGGVQPRNRLQAGARLPVGAVRRLIVGK